MKPVDRYFAYNWFSWNCCNKFCSDPFGNKNVCNKTCTPHKWEDIDYRVRCSECLAFADKSNIKVKE